MMPPQCDPLDSHLGGPTPFVRLKTKKEPFVLYIIKHYFFPITLFPGRLILINTILHAVKILPRIRPQKMKWYYPAIIMSYIGPLWARICLFSLGFYTIQSETILNWKKFLSTSPPHISVAPSHIGPVPDGFKPDLPPQFDLQSLIESLQNQANQKQFHQAQFISNPSLNSSNSNSSSNSKKNPPSSHSFILSGNHSGLFDGLLLWNTSWSPCVVKQAFSLVPLFGSILKKMGFVFVPRKGHLDYGITGELRIRNKSTPTGTPSDLSVSKSKHIDHPVLKNQKISTVIKQRAIQDFWSDSLASGTGPLCCFPESTTTNNRFLTHFYSGSFSAGLPVQILVIRYDFQYFSPTWESIPAFEYFKTLLCQIYNQASILKLPIYYPSQSEIRNPKLYARNIQILTSFYSGYPITQTFIQDKFIFHQVLTGKLGKIEGFKLGKEIRSQNL